MLNRYSLMAFMPWYLEIFVQSRDMDGAEGIAYYWALTMLVIGFLVGLSMIVAKIVLKESARGIITKLTWSRKKTRWFIIAGLLPVAILTLFFWYFGGDFEQILGAKGLIVGLVLAGLLYMGVILAGHLGQWRREIF